MHSVKEKYEEVTYGKGVAVNWEEKNQKISVAGDLGQIEKIFGGKEIVFGKEGFFLYTKGGYETWKSVLGSMVEGVSGGYYTELEFVGLGYRIINVGTWWLLKVGYSHYIRIPKEEGICYFGFKNNLIIYGLDFGEVNTKAAMIRGIKAPEVYKGKGIRYKGEEIKLKVGKSK